MISYHTFDTLAGPGRMPVTCGFSFEDGAVTLQTVTHKGVAVAGFIFDDEWTALEMEIQAKHDATMASIKTDAGEV